MPPDPASQVPLCMLARIRPRCFYPKGETTKRALPNMAGMKPPPDLLAFNLIST